MRLYALTATLVGAAALQVSAQPSLHIGMDMAPPGGKAQLQILYDGRGSNADRVGAEIAVDQVVFTSGTIRCNLPFRCFRNPRGNLVILGSALPSTQVPVGESELSVALTTPPGRYPVTFVSETYQDDQGGDIQPMGSTTGLVEVVTPPPLTTMSLSRTARGSALIFPYFTVRGRQETVYAIENVSPRAKALRVNIREGLNGRIVAAWNVYLLREEGFRFRISPSQNTGGAVVRSGGCTFPSIPPLGVELDGTAFRDDPATDAAARLREGLVEVIALADLGTAATGDLLAGCASLTSRFDPGNTWDMDPTIDTLDLFGEIAGIASQRGLPGTVAVDAPATAIRGFASMNLHSHPTNVVDLNSGNVRVTKPVDATGPDSKGNVSISQTLTYNTSIEAVSALLMTERVRLPVWARGTEWIFSFPTKPYFTDPSVAIMAPPVDPFSSVLGNTGACEPVTISFLPAVNVMRDLCFVTSTVSFDGRDLFNSELAAPAINVSTDRFGLATFSGSLTDVDSRRTLTGLPVIARAVPYRAGKSPGSRRISLARDAAKNVQSKGDPEAAGRSVMVRGRLVFVGIPGASGGRGEVQIYRRHGTVLVPEAILTPPPEFAAASFGAAMDVDGTPGADLLGIGAPGAPPPGSKGSTMQGAIYQRLFDGQWNVKFNWTDAASTDAGFGASVALDGDMIAFGAPADDSADVDAGAVYLFDIDGNSMGQALPDEQNGGAFGQSMDFKNGLMAVGSPAANGQFGSAMGAMTMYDLIAGNLSTPQTVEMGTSAGDAFGSSVALSSSGFLAVGAPGVDGESGDQQGAVITYDFDGGSLLFNQTLVSDDAGSTGNFGAALGFNDGGELAIGAPGALGSEGSLGSIYVYSELESEYLQMARISPEEPGLDGFGEAVEIDGEDIIIGAPAADGSAGAAVLISETEVLFFDDFETMLLPGPGA